MGKTMTRPKSLKYINKLKSIAMNLFGGTKEEDRLRKEMDLPDDAKDEIDDIFDYKQGKHKLKRKKRAKRTKLKK
jgi:hypothetical protein